MKELELINTETNKAFKVKFGILNGIRFNKIAKLSSEYRNATKEVNMIYMLAMSDKNVLNGILNSDESVKPYKGIIEAIANGTISYEQVVALFDQDSALIASNNMAKRIEIIKTMIDYNSVNDATKKLLDDEDFWLSQDYTLIQEAAEFFRSKLRG